MAPRGHSAGRTRSGLHVVRVAAVAALAAGCGQEAGAARVESAGAAPARLSDGSAAAPAATPDATVANRPGDAGRPAPACTGFEHVADFTPALRETSGLARSARAADVLWTHNDSGGEPALTAIDLNGRALGTVRVPEARNRDWEALSAGPCPEGDCLYIGDIGDNLNERDPVTIYRILEPAPDAGTSAPARAWSVRYPGGPRDAEALAVHPRTGQVWIVSKGRAKPVQVYRVALPEHGESVVAEPVVTLTRGAVPFPRMVTGATFTPDGGWLLVRSYTELFFLPVDSAGVPGPTAGPAADLSELDERQGEAVEAFSGGVVYFTSEAEGAGRSPELSRARCDLD